MFKLAIFDLDGTLLNTLTDIVESCNCALRKCGFPAHEADAYKDFIGRASVYLVTQALPENSRDDETVKKVHGIFVKRYNERPADYTEPYHGVIDMLKALKSAGVKTAIYSNKLHDLTLELDRIYFPGLIDMPVGFKDGVPPKPDPVAGIGIMEHFGADRSETVYIGDSGVDMQTAKRLGVYAVGVSWGFRPKEELLVNGADVIVDKAGELIKIIVDK